MNLPQHLIKIKLTYNQAASFTAYVLELIKNSSEYLQPIETSKAKQAIYLQHLHNLFKAVSRHTLVNAIVKKPHTLKLNQGERFTLLLIINVYPLPLDIDFIAHELKNQLFTTDFKNDYLLN